MNANYVTEQNKLSTSGAWIWLLEILTPTGYDDLYYTNNNAIDPGDGYSTTTWPTVGGHRYWTLPFSMDDVSISTSGKFPEYRLHLNSVVLGSKLREYVQATGGLVGSIVRLMVVHSAHLSLTTPAVDEYAEILDCEVTAGSVIFTVGIPSLLGRRFPRDRYVPSFCRHRFVGALCRYVKPAYAPFTTSLPVSFLEPKDGEVVNSIYFTAGVNIIAELFRNAPGEPQGVNRALTRDTGFTVRGSIYNDGYFIADNNYPVHPNYVYVKMDGSGGRALTVETIATGVTIQLGYDACDHTLVGCRRHDNSQNYGGSPGIVGGVYG